MEMVSIIIPVYNGSNYLRFAIDSALAQTYDNVEVLVVNDGSSDDGMTESVALEYGDKIRYLAKENGGVSSALNAGIASAHGEWVSWLSHDDVYSPDKIERQITALDQSGHVGARDFICLCGGCFIGPDGSVLAKRPASRTSAGEYSAEEMLRKVAGGFSIGGCGMLVPKKAYDAVGPFDESMRYVQDVDMWARLFDAGFGLVHRPDDRCVQTRIHPMQGQSTIRHLWQPESATYSQRLAGYLLKLEGGHELVRNMARRCYSVGDFAGGDSSQEVLIANGGRGLGLFERELYKMKGHLRQAARSAYHRVAHGFWR